MPTLPETINTGTPNNKDGDKLRNAFIKVVNIFNDVYSKLFTKTSELINDGENGTNPFISTINVVSNITEENKVVTEIDVDSKLNTLQSEIPTLTSQITNDGENGVNPFINETDLDIGNVALQFENNLI